MTLKWLSSYAPVDEEFDKVSLLLHGDGTNGSTTIVDSSSNVNSVTANNGAQISTTQSKFGGSSIEFLSTANTGLSVTPSSVFQFGTGDWTVEAWIYQRGQAQYSTLYEIGRHASADSMLISVGSNGFLVYAGGFFGPQTNTFTLNTWQHTAVTRAGNLLYFFLNGTIVGNSGGYSFTNDLTSTSTVSVAYPYGFTQLDPNYRFNGYIDDFRITKGVARYTANFTPPTAPFPDLGPRIPQHIVLQSPTANDPLLDLNTQPSLDLQFATGKTLNDRVSGNNLITFSRADATTCATYVDSNGVIQTAAANVPRFDHDPVTGESLGLLIEESRTNLQFPSIPATSVLAITVTANAAVAPDGTTTATFCEPDNIGSGVRSSPVSIAKNANEFYAHTFFFKPDGYNVAGIDYGSGGPDTYAEAWIDVTNNQSFVKNTLKSVTSTSLANGWYRITVIQEIATSGTTPSWGKVLSCRPNVPTTSGQSYTRVSGAGGFFWGHQEELGSFPTSYIPTSGSTVTRAADVASITGTNFSSWYNQSEGTVFAEYDGLKDYARVLYLNTGKTLITSRSTINQAYDGATSTASAPDYGLTLGDTRKSVTAYSGTTITLTISGLVPVTGNSDFTSTTNTGIFLGGQGSNANVLNGHISRLTYYPYRLADATLQEITS
jgi:hypothetical protein